MLNYLYKSTIIIACFVICLSASAQNVKEPANAPADWSKPYPAFRIAGNLYYVGTYDLACYLIASPQGHVLINTGLASSASIIKSNVESLNFNYSDIKVLLTTQAHYDHMAAMATIKKETGAKFMVDEKDAEAVSDGGNSDYALGGNGSSYEPVAIDRLLKDADTITLGGTVLTLLHHPGHTKGSCSYIFTIKDEKRSYRVLIANLPSIVTDKGFSDIPAYPDIAKDYKHTFESLKILKFDIWLASHASQFDLHKKHKPGDSYNPSAFFDRKGYDKAVNDLEKTFKKRK